MNEASTAARLPAAPPRRPTRRWSRALVGATAAVTAAAAAVQMAATFLYDAPANPVSAKYRAQIDWWMNPLLNQDWELFAPNPISENLEVDARVSVGPSAEVTPWTDLSAIDRDGTVGNPAPTHLTMNGLRNAWREYTTTHEASGLPNSPLASVAQQYLENLVLQYLSPREPGRIDSVQVRFVVTLIPGPGRSAAQTAPQTQTLPWWVIGS